MSEPNNPDLSVQDEVQDFPIDPLLVTPEMQPPTLESAISSTIADSLQSQPDNIASSSSNECPQTISIATIVAAMSSIQQAEIPEFTPYVPNTGSNGRRASASAGKGVNGPHRSVGPELSTPSKLSQVSGGSFIPTGKPPYEPPEDIIYPPDRIVNPFWGDMTPQPIIENFPANSLYRPKYLPSDIDDRLDKRSVWIGIEKDSSRAVYFLPPTCLCCKNPAVAQHCDRGWPTCSRCIGRGVTCIPGKAWGMMRPKGKRRNLKAEASKSKTDTVQTPSKQTNGMPGPSKSTNTTGTTSSQSTSAKGKGKAPEQLYIAPPPLPDLPSVARETPMEIDLTVSPIDQMTSSKKRRLSSTAEADPKRVRRKSNTIRDTNSLLPLSSDLPLSKTDREYFSRLEDNARKSPLTDMRGPCPVWAKTRRSLQVAAEYFRNPTSSAGASVEIGAGGIARGVILEGEVMGAQGLFWGQGKDTGIIMTSIGHPRRKQSFRPNPEPAPLSSQTSNLSAEPIIRSSTPPLDILSSVHNARNIDISPEPVTIAQSDVKPLIQHTSTEEAPEISALLMAQRARTPIAVAVAQDYSSVPFKVPRPFIVLGWFWITDAWLEPVMPDLELFTPHLKKPSAPPEFVTWKFRFDWCIGGQQDSPWWSSALITGRPSLNGLGSRNDEEWPISASDSGSTTVSPPSTSLVTASSTINQHVCAACRYSSKKVYEFGDLCLNEGCSWFFGDVSSESNRIGPISNRPFPSPLKSGILPENLGLRLRPPEPSGISHDVTQSHAGREYWRGWVCNKCGLAQERYKWAGWNCEACGHSIQPPRRIYTAEDLRPPSRPVCTSTRQDDGYASFPPGTIRSWSLFDNDIKVVKHTFDPLVVGEGSEVHHVLSHEGKDVNKIAGEALKGLQVQGEAEVPFRRYTATSTTRRPAELTLSPFYTYLCGSDSTPLPGFPTYRSIHWQDAPPVCLDVMDLINHRSGMTFPGQPEFGSLLITANPPNLSARLTSKLVVEPNTYMSVLFLGSDGDIRMRNIGGRGKSGELTFQHGDVVGFKAGSESIEATLRMDNFGFFCIARHAKSTEPPLPLTATSDSTFSVDSFAHPHIRSDSHYPSSSVEPLSATLPPDIPPPSYADESSIIVTPYNAPPRNFNTPLFVPKRPKSKPVLPPKPVKLAVMSMENWYIGSYPLDPNQPLRIYPPYRRTGSNENEIKEDDSIKLIYLQEEPPSTIQLDPPPLSPLPGYDDLEPEEPVPPPPTTTTGKKSTPANKKGSKSTTTTTVTPIATPTRTSAKKKKNPRASISATPAGSVIDPEEGTPSVKSVSTPSARGGKKAKGKGRKSGA
ncbi:uncharacterized protein L201_000126 [Kwoniella dendrophila CBS 6074]|uniref:Zn(2)-C6 fungal-type domain-containing protein n=1 Tax=Kwoniella dendrophila CBS 6074 TaxID=1295534 RepID=A0AAX4JK50_9TREE